VQAGGSPPGRNFAARFGEAIFTAQTRLPEAQDFRRSTHELMAKFGRRPEEVAIMPGLSPLLADTEAEANRLIEELSDYVHPETGIWMLSENLNFPLYDYDSGAKLPIADIREALGSRTTTTIENLLGTAEREDLSILALARKVARSRQHHSFVGTPGQLADLVQTWFEEGACDGFNIMPPVFHDQLAKFVDHAVPELQRRGLFRREYEGTTLRDHLGLQRPSVNRAGRAAAAAQ
jgi:alkanesulfonate monooxygenase SsuD/methylene tetrahydromethanopterin reductase-like flavin-dependent oxidoreductase (luciferase family)